ncbi:hypothetical protein BDB00DRAFT_830991 [Zychaea mexicana]|uniref:uncharacterized protein n=1 Tax=Zychaea mexicana TaxID=64656 RepID=UPI0022FDEB98|nr:uncharacterized protein BDB00DRAFT_830991 [Zychaea mexicana]KAI9491873.1 hypothetical protein BDB00DRAFT_830991 [Zychaea mexicana]
MARVTDARYICQSAANAIISEIGPYRVSNDALQAINQFLDEFLVYLLSSSLSLDLSRIKAVVFTLLPSTLGKNAIVEAELEVKTFTETEAIDYESYERMRMLGGTNGTFPLNDALPLLREKCLEFCTLADREEPSNSAFMNNTSAIEISIAPIVAIYVTTVLEHIAEYVLTAIAMTAENEDIEYIRVKEVFLALIDDVQVGGVFYRMELREKLEKRAFAYGYRPRTSTYAPSIQQQKHVRSSTAGSAHNGAGDNGAGFLDITFDDLDLGYDDDEGDRPNNNNGGLSRNEHLSMSAYSMKSNFSQQRPTSMMSSSTSNGTISTFDSAHNNNNNNNNKKAFKVFNKDGPPERPVSVSVYDPDAPTMNFEDLIRSGNTMRVSLTPNRLRSIEVKDQTVDEPPAAVSWERRSTTSMSRTRGSAPPSRSASPAPRGDTRTYSNVPLPRPPVTSTSSRASSPSPSVKKKDSFLDDALQEYESLQKSNLGPRATTPAATPTAPIEQHPTKARSSQVSAPASVSPPTRKQPAISSIITTTTATTTSQAGHSRFENPREAPEPPKPKESPMPAVAPSPPTPSQQHAPAVPPELQQQHKPATTSSPIEKVEKSVPTTPQKKEEQQQQPQPPRIMRRSSMSSRKSRENLRRQREKEEQALAAAASTELPKQQKQQQPSTSSPSSSPVISAKSSQESVRDDSILPSPPASGNASATSKDSIKERDEQQKVMDSEEEEKKAVHFDNSDDDDDDAVADSPVEMTKEEQQKLKQDVPERPSTIVAKRASMAGSSRRQSLHESYAVGEKLDTVRQRLSTAGSVEMSVKGWETIMKHGDDAITPAAQRRRRSTMKRPEEDEEKENSSTTTTTTTTVVAAAAAATATTTTTITGSSPQPRDPPLASRQPRPVSSVLDKVMQFEQANSLDDFAQQHHRQHRASAYIPRRERFLYLQREPGVLERRTNTFANKPRPIAVDAEVQTEPIALPTASTSTSTTEDDNAPPALVITTEDDMGVTTRKELDMESGSEHGMVDGDEEWFLQDDEWEDTQEQETAVVEWLLGEA